MNVREKFIGVNSITFNKRFKNDNDYYEHLSLVKWEDGFTCRKCKNGTYYKGKKSFSRRCLKCKYDESPTVNTMFEKLKFSVLIAFKISTKKKGMSSLELSNEFELRQKTCWSFKQKVEEALKSSLKSRLTGIVHADEFVIVDR